MSGTTTIPLAGGVIAIPESVQDDPRVIAKMEELKSTPQVDDSQAAAVEDSDFSTLEKYGLKPRQAGLKMASRMARVISFCPLQKVDGTDREERNIPDEYMGHVGVFLIGAPVHVIVDSIEIGKRDGFGAFMECVDNWFTEAGLPDEASQESADEIAKIFTLSAKLSQAQGQQDGGSKKNQSHGSLNAPTSSVPSTAGLKTISGSKSQSHE